MDIFGLRDNWIIFVSLFRHQVWWADSFFVCSCADVHSFNILNKYRFGAWFSNLDREGILNAIDKEWAKIIHQVGFLNKLRRNSPLSSILNAFDNSPREQLCYCKRQENLHQKKKKKTKKTKTIPKK